MSGFPGIPPSFYQEIFRRFGQDFGAEVVYNLTPEKSKNWWSCIVVSSEHFNDTDYLVLESIANMRSGGLCLLTEIVWNIVGLPKTAQTNLFFFSSFQHSLTVLVLMELCWYSTHVSSVTMVCWTSTSQQDMFFHSVLVALRNSLHITLYQNQQLLLNKSDRGSFYYFSWAPKYDNRSWQALLLFYFLWRTVVSSVRARRC